MVFGVAAQFIVEVLVYKILDIFANLLVASH